MERKAEKHTQEEEKELEQDDKDQRVNVKPNVFIITSLLGGRFDRWQCYVLLLISY